jgi:hypothetical protein
VLPPYVSQVTTQAAAVTAYVAWNARAASPDTCTFFPELIADLPCYSKIPAREQVTRVAAYSVLFEDPPGVRGNGFPSGGPYPAASLLMVHPKGSSQPIAAHQETCTLPQVQHALCTTILSDFRRRLRP